MIAGSALASEIVQVWVIGSKPGTGMFWFPAVDAGISKTMLSTPGLGSLLAAMIASRRRARPRIAGVGDDEGQWIAGRCYW